MSNPLNISVPSPFQYVPDNVNVYHLGRNFYAMKYPRNERVVLATVTRLKKEFGIDPPVEFKKEGLNKKGSERIATAKELKKYPAVLKGVKMLGLDPYDFILIRFGPEIEPAE
jgi:hypothetical protein